jgi:hypothetical protein
MVGKTKPATKAEKARMDRISQMRCVACWMTGLCCGKTEVHHLTSGGRRRGHMDSVPLGQWHHRGIPLEGYTSNQMRLHFGPSLRLESKAFRATYGTDDELLAKVNAIISELERAA